MKMPEKGQMLVIFPDGTSYVCFNGMRERLAQTEAVPVLPHGRLIDANALFEAVFMVWGIEYDASDCNTLMSLINDAPTVIPTEEGEEIKEKPIWEPLREDSKEG
jgi:hypothetical protein